MPRTLFGNKLISTINFSQQEILQNIIELHCKSDIELDPTYSTGGFYSSAIAKPKFRFDIKPKSPDVQKSKCTNLPLPAASIETMIFDPPFMANGYNSKSDYKLVQRFGAIENMGRLWRLYHRSLREFHRILKPNGILIFKCQDVVDGRYNWFSHVEVCNIAFKLGFYPKDLFILLSKNRIISVENQVHARKFHSYFWVFQKKVSYVKYNTAATYKYNEMPKKRRPRAKRK